MARVAAVEDATATDGVIPAAGLGGDRRRRGLSNGYVGGVNELPYRLTAEPVLQ